MALVESSLANWKALQRHELSSLFGDMEDDFFSAFAEDMGRDGYDKKQPILIYQGKILDGWQRHRAAVKKGTQPYFETYAGADPLGEVIMRNFSRRHLTDTQRAMIAAKIYDNFRGNNPQGVPIGTPLPQEQFTYAKCAKLLQVTRRSFARASAVVVNGTPELQAAVAAGDVSLSAGADVAKLEPEKQDEIVKEAKKPKLKKTGSKRGKKTLRQQVDESLAEVEKDDEPKTMDEIISKKNSALESVCRSLMRVVNEELATLDDAWLDYSDRRAFAIGKVKDACSTIRSIKCYRACPMCKGDGCGKCQKTGRVPKATYDQMV